MRRSAASPSCLILLCACAGGSTARAPSAATPPVVEVVVANQQSASASLVAGDAPVATHVRVGTGPHEAAVSPDGRIAVVTIYGTQTPGNELAVVDLVNDSVSRTIDLGAYTRPHGVVFLDDRSVVVTSESTGNIVVVDLPTGVVEAIPTEARGSHMVAVEASGRRAWTANVVDNTVSEMDLPGRRFLRSYPVPARPEGIAVTPDGAQVWVGSNETGAVTVLDPATGETLATLRETSFPYRLTAAPDGRRVAIVDGEGDALVVADVATLRVSGRIALDSPRGVAIAPDSRTAYVTLAAGGLAVVDLETLSVRHTIAVQSSPDGVGVGWR